MTDYVVIVSIRPDNEKIDFIDSGNDISNECRNDNIDAYNF